MKYFISSLLIASSFSVSAFEDNYTCRVRQYRIDLTLTQDTSTSLFFTDGYDINAIGYAGWIEKSQEETRYHFYSSRYSPMILTFKTKETQELPENIVGWIDVSAPFFSLWDKLICKRRT